MKQNNIKQILAYQNNSSLKEETVNRMKEHIELDQLIQGDGYDDSTSKGCAVGCAIDRYDHDSFATKLGVDVWIPYLYDTIHEGIDIKETAKFNVNFLDSIPVGMTAQQSDMVRLKIFHFMLTKIIPAEFQKYKKTAVVIDLFEKSIKGEEATKTQWDKVADDITRYKFRHAFASASASASVSASAFAFASAFASDYASASASASEYASAYASVSAFASDSASAAVSAFASDSKSKQEAMLKIGNKLIEIFREIS